MSEAPDFEVLRAKRNAEISAFADKMKAEGWNVSECAFRDASACYCTCGMSGEGGNLCEHTWDGEPYESADGCEWSTTCSRCGITSMSHSLRTAP